MKVRDQRAFVVESYQNPIAPWCWTSNSADVYWRSKTSNSACLVISRVISVDYFYQPCKKAKNNNKKKNNKKILSIPANYGLVCFTFIEIFRFMWYQLCSDLHSVHFNFLFNNLATNYISYNNNEFDNTCILSNNVEFVFFFYIILTLHPIWKPWTSRCYSTFLCNQCIWNSCGFNIYAKDSIL